MIRLHRRELLAAGTFGLGALAAPGTAQILAARGFTHNVASGGTVMAEAAHDWCVKARAEGL